MSPLVLFCRLPRLLCFCGAPCVFVASRARASTGLCQYAHLQQWRAVFCFVLLHCMLHCNKLKHWFVVWFVVDRWIIDLFRHRFNVCAMLISVLLCDITSATHFSFETSSMSRHFGFVDHKCFGIFHLPGISTGKTLLTGLPSSSNFMRRGILERIIVVLWNPTVKHPLKHPNTRTTHYCVPIFICRQKFQFVHWYFSYFCRPLFSILPAANPNSNSTANIRFATSRFESLLAILH